AQARDLGAVDERPPPAVGEALADVELHRVRADVDHRVPPDAEPDERLEPARHVDVGTRAEPELAHGCDHATRVLRLDGDRAPRAVLGTHHGDLGHATADRVVPALLVDVDRAEIRIRLDNLADELLEGVRIARQFG